MLVLPPTDPGLEHTGTRAARPCDCGLRRGSADPIARRTEVHHSNHCFAQTAGVVSPALLPRLAGAECGVIHACTYGGMFVLQDFG